MDLMFVLFKAYLKKLPFDDILPFPIIGFFLCTTSFFLSFVILKKKVSEIFKISKYY